MTPEETKRLLEIARDVKDSLPEVKRIVSENAQYRRWLLWIIAWAAGHGLMPVIFNEIRAKMPDLFRDGKRKPK